MVAAVESMGLLNSLEAPYRQNLTTQTLPKGVCSKIGKQQTPANVQKPEVESVIIPAQDLPKSSESAIVPSQSVELSNLNSVTSNRVQQLNNAYLHHIN